MSLSNFHDVRFPMALAFGAVGGPVRRTNVVTLASGREVRNSVWANARRRWDVGSAVERLDELNALIAFFEARKGRFHGFRFRDFADDRSCAPEQTPAGTDQLLGIGDGQETEFQMVKHYGSTRRPIVKPVPDTELIAIDGAQVADYTLETSTGLVTFDSAPPPGASITAGYRFDCAARFDSDSIDASLEAFGAGRIISVPILEILG
ncbi:MAG: DUF2460 domain-containing protein [Pseudomonadota bacterium]